MSVLVLLFAGTLAVIFASSYYEVSASNYEMLYRHAQMYLLPEEQAAMPQSTADGEAAPPTDENRPPFPSPEQPPEQGGMPPHEDTHAFRVATFYSVAVADDGSLLATDTAGRQAYTAQTLEALACEILQEDKKQGTKEQLLFLVHRKIGYTLVAFMDNTLLRESMTTLFRYTLLFGSVALLFLFLLAIVLARRIVSPLEKSYRKQKQFISDAGHELKTPVSVVNANAEMLLREIGDNQWLANIRYENERMGQLVTQLLTLARTENASDPMQPLDLSRLVAGDTLPFESIAFEKGLLLQTDIAEGITVNGNSQQLSRLVCILLDNAVSHGKGGKEIRIQLQEHRSFVLLTVTNAADPIPPDKMQQLFERFYRADEARGDEENHYGLGLSIAKAIVTAHRGKIEADCRQGEITFSVRLPKS